MHRFDQWRIARIRFAAPFGLIAAGLAGFGERTACGTDAVDYQQNIKPLLAKRCTACHGALRQEGELRLDTVELMRQGGSSGPVLASREDPRAQASELIRRVRSSDDAERMPPESKPLDDRDIAMLEAWIAAGAPGPIDEVPQADPLQHWAFQSPRRPPVPEPAPREPTPPENAPLKPASSGNTSQHPIDRFLQASASQLGVVPLDEASPRELLRRATLDLIGLPPTPEELDKFLSDRSPDAYRRAVDRLLERPEYGQRWGRHWMDVWRYSDWYGRRAVPDVMNSYPQIWRWRDWIVRSLNADKPYSRMIVEMLAADEISPTDDENIVATGFIVRNWFKWNYETWMKDNVEHTGKAFLGLTLNCAQCHDHKFDPVTQEDYFRFRAFFEPLELRHERVAGEADPGPFQKYEYTKSYGPIQTGAIRIFDEKLDAQTFMFRGGDARNRIEGRPPVEPGPPRALTPGSFRVEPIELPPEASYPGLKDFVRQDEREARQREIESAATAVLAAQQAAEATAMSTAAATEKSTDKTTGGMLAAQQANIDAQLGVRIALAAASLAVARRDALEAGIAADDAAYRDIGDPADAARAAHLAEKLVPFRAAELALLQAELATVQAERAVPTTPAAAPASDSAAPAAPASPPAPAANALEQPSPEVTAADNAQQDKAQQEKAQLEKARAAAEAAAAAAREKLRAARAALDSARTQLAVIETTYTPLSPKYPSRSSGRRTALAYWIASDANPLTARVAVNHMWLRHFGQPLVETVDNFGHQGKLPVHPELLDWLAVDFMEHDWSMKHLHRLIVTSAAYRRSSSDRQLDRFNAQRDRDNTTLWRFPSRRMEAEVVRDSVLACAGQLDRTIGGHEIDVSHWVSSPRRSLYFTQHGEAQMLFLSTFDGANACECYRRTSTVLPSQALAMANSELLVHYGRLCAARISKAVAPETHRAAEEREGRSVARPSENSPPQLVAHEPFVHLAFETLLGRRATAAELAASIRFFEAQSGLAAAPATAATQVDGLNDQVGSTRQPAAPVQTQQSTAAVTATADGSSALQPPSADPLQRARENFVIALFNHNDFITIR